MLSVTRKVFLLLQNASVNLCCNLCLTNFSYASGISSSESCQRSHWNSEHKTKCKDLQSLYKDNYTKPKSALRGRKASVVGVGGTSEICKQSNKVFHQLLSRLLTVHISIYSLKCEVLCIAFFFL